MQTKKEGQHKVCCLQARWLCCARPCTILCRAVIFCVFLPFRRAVTVKADDSEETLVDKF